MWQKAAFLAFFADLCLAQRGAILDFHARRWSALAAFASESTVRSGDNEIPSPQSLHTSSSDNTLNTFDLRSAQDEALPDGVFTTVLYPSVPTEAPTGVMVPTVITYTGNFDSAVVPTGYILETPAVPAPTPGGSAGPQTEFPTQPVPTQAPTEGPSIGTFPRPSDQSHGGVPTSSMGSSKMSARPNSHSASPTSTLSSTHSSTHSTSSGLSTSTSSSSRTSSSSSASASGTNLSTSKNGANTQGPDRNPHLSQGAVAGIAVGAVAFTVMLAGVFLLLLRRRTRPKTPDSPTIYPQEAYLYDPPITPPPSGPGAAGAEAPRNVPRPPTPEMGMTERSGLLAGAGAVAAAGAAARSRRGTMSGNNSPALRPTGTNGYTPVETRDITELSADNPFMDPPNAFQGIGNPQAWPLNPNAPSGLGTPPGSAAGPRNVTAAAADTDPVESRSQTPGSMYRDNPGRPSIAGVGSPRYERRISSNAINSGVTGPTGYNPAMQEARRAWGMED
ncbi:hypothetical protein, variant [Verruconis gallopava]|uniref:Mid2 domain-containing protein n=1 Tax=Verruconis gallopava TaxID=253628 RepID=A0A0D2AAX5_9PEZI|nr:hypothetical protein, variant [Verruconis gallopava]KIW03928.1 hypothetical protein, variant [Verruconis gallopava]